MIIKVDDVELCQLTDIQKKVIKDTINADIFEDDMKRRLQWILMHVYDQCFKKLKDKWDNKLAAAGVEMIPTDKDAYAQLVFQQEDYKDRKARDEAAKVD